LSLRRPLFGVDTFVTRWAHNPLNRLVEISGTDRISYTQSWDVENRLSVVTNTVTNAVTGEVTCFVYDGDGALSSRTIQTLPEVHNKHDLKWYIFWG